MIDITELATDVNNLSTFISNNFTIIYPNGGTKASTDAGTSNIAVNTRYICDNPFPGYNVNCVAEIYTDGGWYNVELDQVINGGTYQVYGTVAHYASATDKIIVITGAQAIDNNPAYSLGAHLAYHALKTAPCRVLVWRGGKK